MIHFAISADRLNIRRVAQLRQLLLSYPGDEPVFPPPADCDGYSEKQLRLNVKVDGSPEFLLAAMGIFDD